MYDLKTIKQKVLSLRILIVDDEEAILKGTTVFMKKFCNQVDTAKNGEDALKKFKEDGPYDIVLTDVRMPKMSGWKLIEALKDIDTEFFSAVMTGSPDIDGVFKSKCDMFMAKPVDIYNMKRMMEMIICIWKTCGRIHYIKQCS